MSRWRPEPVVVRVPDGADPLAALRELLPALAPRRGMRVVFALPLALLRLQLVPWNDTLVRPAERLAFAQACLREVYGELMRDWVVCLDEPAFGEPALACAVPGGLRDGLIALAHELGLKVAGVEPAFLRVFNERVRARGRDAAPMWLAVSEPPAMALLLVEGGRVRRVKIVAARAPAPRTQAAREWLVLGREGACPEVLVAEVAPAAAAVA